MPQTDFAERRLKLKKAILSRAISENRGPEAIKKLDHLYRNIKATRDGTDDEIIGALSHSLSNGQARITMLQLMEVGSLTGSRYLRALNMLHCLTGSPLRYLEAHFVPGTATIN